MLMRAVPVSAEADCEVICALYGPDCAAYAYRNYHLTVHPSALLVIETKASLRT